MDYFGAYIIDSFFWCGDTRWFRAMTVFLSVPFWICQCVQHSLSQFHWSQGKYVSRSHPWFEYHLSSVRAAFHNHLILKKSSLIAFLLDCLYCFPEEVYNFQAPECETYVIHMNKIDSCSYKLQEKDLLVFIMNIL